ncbi:lysophospholipid acyltransferase family protein [Sansalvadorimonas sp. 2012CJ34-2]|uniref:Lysophospholipid acyltransferase family protein n=1 Tax=Parendozoicomonas callyspongiae TaxID=2942213 RepID=A0ABT0PK13_9GAMM|nr:lysophospholipid acyltransferase family protein [Sansalvadorimonas sp. 2012CJ34-2]MCL6271694.1 lysophospholipid acyltransferase family protein [Sansalvadorimonas sp. 2012CJ34-2]
MNRTVFNTPVVRHFFKWLSWIGLKLTGWKVEGQAPDARKYVLIAVPHTSNWDFPVTLAMFFKLGIQAHWMGKASLFKGPMGPIMKYLGGIPVDRSKSNGMVQQLVEEFNRCKELIVTIPPEGTRKKVQQWKSGFYHVASGANVPIALGFMDFKTKKGGIQKLFYPTGDYEADLVTIQDFYRSLNVFGKRPTQTA